MPWVAIPTQAFKDRALNRTDLMTIAVVALHDRMGRNRQGCRAGRETLAEESGINASSLSTSLTKVTGMGYLRRERRGADGRRHTYFVEYGRGRQFARLPDSIIGDPRIDEAAFRTLGAIAKHDHGAGQGCFASRERLAHFAGLKTNTVSVALDDLEQANYIVRRRSIEDARRLRIYVLAFGEPPELVASGQPISVASGQPTFEEESCPKTDDRLHLVNLNDGDRLLPSQSIPNENNGLDTPIVYVETLREIDFVETRINSGETVTENRHDEKRENVTNSAVGEVEEKGPGKKGSQAITVASRRLAAEPVRTVDPDTLIIESLASVGVGHAQGWVILMSLPADDISLLRKLATQGGLTRQVLEAATTAALNAPQTGLAAMDWSAVA